MNPDTYKRCSKCKKYFPKDYEHFFRSKYSEGFSSKCKKCQRETCRESYRRKKEQKIPCSVKGCNNISEKLDKFCGKHYSQLRIHGKIFEYTAQDRSPIRIEKEFGYLTVFQGKCDIAGEVIIDIENVEKVKGIRWSFNGQEIIMNSPKQVRFLTYLIPPKKGYRVVNISDDWLDCRKSNLGYFKKNHIKRTRADNTSGKTGVSWSKIQKRWEVQMVYQGEKHHSFHVNLEDALKKRIQLEEELGILIKFQA